MTLILGCLGLATLCLVSFCGFLALGVFLNLSDRAAIKEGDRLWEEGDKAGAVAKYESRVRVALPEWTAWIGRASFSTDYRI